MLVGFVDSVDRHGISGWAADARRPNAPVELLIFINGQLGGRIIADEPREDIKQLRTYGEGRHGFHFFFDAPLSLLRHHELLVSFAATRTNLDGGRIALAKQGLAEIGGHRPDDGTAAAQDELSPVMVTSTGRSGTTLLMRRLGNVPGVAIGEQFPFEVKLVTYYAKAFEILTSPGNREKSVSPELIFDDIYHVGSNPYYHYFFQEVFPRRGMLNEYFSEHVPPIVGAAFKQIISGFYRRLAETHQKQNVRYFAEKCDVFNTARDFARALYPGMREIILLRDPRDVYCSQRAFWSAEPAQAFQALRSVRDRMLEFHAENAPNLLFVTYEDLVREPQSAMARISDLLGLAEPIAIDQAVEDQQFKQHGTSRDAGASIGRWRRELTNEELRNFDQEFGAYFDTFGYERFTPVLPPSDRGATEPPPVAARDTGQDNEAKGAAENDDPA